MTTVVLTFVYKMVTKKLSHISGQLMATWTAPGDDFDVGVVTGYRFVVAENYSNLLDPMAETQTLVGFQQPDKAGASTSYQFGLARIDEHYDKDIYLGN